MLFTAVLQVNQASGLRGKQERTPTKSLRVFLLRFLQAQVGDNYSLIYQLDSKSSPLFLNIVTQGTS